MSDRYSIRIISSLIPGKGFEQFLELLGVIPADFHIAGGVNDRFPDYGNRLIKKLDTLRKSPTGVTSTMWTISTKKWTLYHFSYTL